MRKKRSSTKTFRRGLSIQVKIGVIMIVLTTLTLSSYGVYQFRTRTVREQQRLMTFAQNVAEQLALNLIDPIWNFDVSQARRVVEAEMRDVNILAIRINDSEQKKLMAKGRDEDWQIIEVSGEIVPELPPARVAIKRGEEQTLGTVDVYMTQRFVETELQRALQEIGMIMLGWFAHYPPDTQPAIAAHPSAETIAILCECDGRGRLSTGD